MPIRGTFEADFTAFNSAVQNAQVQLRSFEAGSAKVESTLSRMSDSFSGRKIIQDATLMAEVFQRSGGAASFTTNELARMGTVGNEALAKMRATGMPIPPQLQAMADAARGATTETSALTAKAVALGAAFGTFAGHLVADSIQRIGSAMVGVVTDAFKMNASLETTTLKFTTLMGDSDRAAAHVKDLFEIAKKTPFETGPIIEASLKLQTFGGAALNTKQNIMLLGDASAATGAPINELGFWVGRMYAMLAGGKPFGEAAMRLQELAVLSPQARDKMEALQKSGASAAVIFDSFRDSLGRFTGAMTTQAGTWEGVMSTFTDTVNMLMADALKPYFEVIRDLGREVNKALDAMSGSMDGVTAATASTKQTFADFITSALNASIKAIGFLMVEFNAAKVVFGDVAQAIDLVRLDFLFLNLEIGKARSVTTGLFDKSLQGQIADTDAKITALVGTMKQRGAQLQADKAAEQDWVEWSNHAVASVTDMTKAVGAASTVTAVHTTVTDASTTAHHETAAAIKKTADEVKKAAAEQKKFLESVVSATDKMHLSTSELYRYNTAIPGARSGTGQLSKEIFGLTKDGLIPMARELTNVARAAEALEAQEKQLNRTHQALATGMITTLPGIGASGVLNFGRVGDAADDLGTRLQGHLRDSLERIPGMFIDAFTGGGGVVGALKGIGISLLEAITKEILDPIYAKFAGWVAKIAGLTAGGGGGGWWSWLLGLFGGGGGGGGGNVGDFPGADLPGAPGTPGGGTTISPPPRNSFVPGGVVEMGQLSFASGTRGKFLDFGAGTRVTLHGRERVQTEGESAGTSNVELQKVTAAVEGLRRDMTFILPTLMAKANATALAKAGVRG